jgi:tRNA 2-thiocytidine biosynthesis protein TtcA
MSMLFTGKTRSMPPKLVSDDGKNVVIRPLCYAAEADIAAFAEAMRFPIIPCDLCGSQENLQRKRVKRLLTELESEHPGVRASLLGAMGNVMPSHLLDRRLHSVQRGLDPWIDDPCAVQEPVPTQLRVAHGVCNVVEHGEQDLQPLQPREALSHPAG